MTFPLPYGEQITVYRPGVTDWRGDQAAGQTHVLQRCAIWQNSTTEDTQGRDTIVTTKTALVPHGADIVDTDLVYLPGDDQSKPARWQVTGDPWPVHSPLSGWEPGTEVQLKRVEG